MDWFDNVMGKMDDALRPKNSPTPPSQPRVRLYLDELIKLKVCHVRHDGLTYRITIEDVTKP